MKTKLAAFTLIAAMSCGAAWAQSNPFAGQNSVKVEVKKTFGSKDKAGAEIKRQSRPSEDVTIGSTKLPKGSILAGHIVDVDQTHQRHAQRIGHHHL